MVHGKGALLAKMPGDYWQKFANLRALYGYMYAHPGKKLLFMGGEIGQWNEWNARMAGGLGAALLRFPPANAGVCEGAQPAVRCPAGAPSRWISRWEGFQWIDFHDVDNSIVSFLRRARNPNDFVVVVANFTPVPREGYRVGVPRQDSTGSC